MTSKPAGQSVQQGFLQALYALFLGGVITALIVIGLLSFFPSPSTANDERLQELDEQAQQPYEDCNYDPDCELTPQERAELDAVEKEREQVYQQIQDEQDDWQRIFGVALIALATGLLAVSLIRWDRAIVISNGVLVGGMFTMIGGIGVTLSSGSGGGQFLVVAAAATVTLVLGYLRFARKPVSAVPQPAVASSAEQQEIAERVAALEARLDDMRRALGG